MRNLDWSLVNENWLNEVDWLGFKSSHSDWKPSKGSDRLKPKNLEGCANTWRVQSKQQIYTELSCATEKYRSKTPSSSKIGDMEKNLRMFRWLIQSKF